MLQEKTVPNIRNAAEGSFAGCVDESPLADSHDQMDYPEFRTRPACGDGSLPENADIQDYQELTARLREELRQHRSHITHLEQRLNLHPRTGMGNQYRMQQDLELRLDTARLSATPACMALGIFRLDANFGVLAKTFKASISDWILYQIGIRIEELLLEGESLYHTRDDEFVVLISRFGSPQSLALRIESMLTAIQKPHVLAGRHIFLSATAGVAQFPLNGNHRSVLLHAADLALDRAVLEKRRFCIFEDEIRHTALKRMDLHASLLNALESNVELSAESQFHLAFQPQVYLRRQKDGSFLTVGVDAEVLLRWKHPDKGAIAPDDFIPFSEESGLILPIGNWVMYQVLEQLKAWKNTEMSGVCLSVNISPKQFLDDRLMKRLVDELRSNPGLHRRLKLEITETCLLENPERSIQRIKYLNSLGLRFSLDDFGKGYSSLGYLSSLPLDSIKLDRQFVIEAETKPASQAVIKAVLLLASRMKLKLICEGVETRSQLHRLLSEGARGFQGYYFSKPVSSRAFEKYHQDQGGKLVLLPPEA